MEVKSGPKAVYSRKDVEEHNKDGDLWLIVDYSVYNVSNWASKHPGGYQLIRCMAGKDCSDVFKTFHDEKILRTILPAFRIGILDDAPKQPHLGKTEIAKDLEKIRESLKKEGAYEPDYFFYLKKGVFNILLLFSALVLVKYSSGYLSIISAGVLVGLFWQQMAFIGHDIGHHSVTQKTKYDDFFGVIIGNFLTGISIGWWKDSHNFHHVVTNSYNYDPDIQHLPVFAVSKKFFKAFYSMYHQKEFKFDWFAKLCVRNQHYLFYPVMAVARLNLYLQSFIYILFKKKDLKGAIFELACCAFFWLWYLTVCSTCSTWSERIVFFAVSHAVAGLIHVQICLSHFSMEVFDGLPQDNYAADGYVKAQFEATMDIDCWPIMDFFHGGLQFQTEHHLFPRAGRNHLRKVQKRVKEFCKKNQIPYYEKSFFQANIEVLKKLKETAEKAAIISPFFIDGLNAVG
eukprot:gene20146-22119_t